MEINKPAAVKRVLMVISRFPPFIGGAERQCFNLSRSLVKKNHQIIVVTEKITGLKNEEIVDGIEIKRLRSFPNNIRFLANLNFWLNLKWFFIRKHRDFDIVHSHVATASAFFGSILAKTFGKVSIVKFTGSGITGEVTTSKATLIGRLKLKILDLFTDVIVCTDEKIKTELITVGYPAEKIRVIANGVDIQYFKPENKSRKDSLKVIFAGRLEDVKNVPTLLKAWKLVAGKTPSAELSVVGDGSKKEELIALKDELGLKDKVKFLGKKSNIKDLLSASDIFVLPSYAEGISNSLLEALSCGLPVVASKVGGTAEIITDMENGLLFEPQDHQKLADHLINLLNNETLRNSLGTKARERIVANYSIEHISDIYLKLYEEFLNK